MESIGFYKATVSTIHFSPSNFSKDDAKAK